MQFAGPANAGSPQGPPRGGCILGPHGSIRIDKKTGNFKAASASRPMQWSHLTEEKQKNQLAQTEFRFIKNK
jgi:hypothetical protein